MSRRAAGERGRCPRDERGAGTAVTASILLITCLSMVVGMWIASWIGGLHEARRAADLAALAAAQAHVGGQPECAAANRVAGANGARVTSCHVQGDLRDFVVEVRVVVALRPAVLGHVYHVDQRATAGSQRLR